MDKINFFTAFTAGVISFLSPCVLPLVPGYLSYISGVSVSSLKEGVEKELRQRVVSASLAFILGFSIVFVLLGASATWIGSFLVAQFDLFSKIAGVVIVIFGLHLMGIVRIPFLNQVKKLDLQVSGRGFMTSLVVGMTFGFGWTPCIGPVLAGILALASTQETIWQGMTLLAVYSLGIGIPFFLTALAFSRMSGLLSKVKQFFRLIEISSGLILIFIGVLIFTGSLGRLSAYFTFLNRFSL